MKSPIVLQPYWDAIADRVCPTCREAGPDGSCALGGSRTCVLYSRLPEIVAALGHARDPSLGAALAALDAAVCGSCGQRAGAERCPGRSRGDCALYARLGLVVEALRTTRAALGD